MAFFRDLRVAFHSLRRTKGVAIAVVMSAIPIIVPTQNMAKYTNAN